MEPDSKAVQFEELLVHAGWVRNLASALVRDPNVADDIAQETWLSALQSQPSDRRNLRGWLGKTLTNVVRQRARSNERRSLREHEPEREPVPTPAELAERLDTQRMLAEEVARLPEPLRATILLRFYEERTPSEIAHDTNVPAGTVRWRLHEGLALLRAQLDARHGDRKSWMLALLPLARPSGVASGSLGAMLGELVLMNLSTKVALAATITLLLAGLAMWRASHFEEAREKFIASNDAGVISGSGPSSNTVSPAAHAMDQRTAIDARPSTQVVITGTVIDLPCPELGMERKPAAGVIVRWYRNSNPSQTLEQSTDDGGRFALSTDKPPDANESGSITTLADADYRSAMKFVPVGAHGAPVELSIERVPHGLLEGETVDEKGAALSGVSLRFQHEDGETSALSDESGRFRIERFRSLSDKLATVSKAGYRAVAEPWPRARESGGWEPLRITLAPATGKLSLTVLDSSGDPLEGVVGRIEVARSERTARTGPEPGFFGNSRPKDAGVTSDPRGRIQFDDVWLNNNLVITLTEGRRTLQATRVAGADLVLSGDAGERIVVGDTPVELRARMPDRVRLQGRVVHADGTPVPRPHIVVSDVDVLTPWANGLTRSFIGDDQGRFTHAFDPTALPCRIQITAADAPLSNHEFMNSPDEDDQRAAYTEAIREIVTIEPHDVHAERSLRLVLEPTFAITGHARKPAGASCGVRVTAVPPGTSDRLLGLRTRLSLVGPDGAFRIDGLAAGVYDLLVDLEKFTQFEGNGLSSWPLAPIRFRDIRAGTEGVDLTVVPQPTVEVTVEARPRTGDAHQIFVLLGQHYPHDSRSERAVEPSSEAIFRDHAGWPASMVVLGGVGDRDEHGRSSFSTLIEPGPSFTWPPLEEGRYWLGLRSHASENDPWSYTEGTGWVYLRPGKYHFVFETDRATTFEGRLRMHEPDRSLCVALADETGQLLRANTDHGSIDSVFPTGADGSFSIGGAPAGHFTLRVGHEDELRAGRYRAVQPIDVSGENDKPLLIEVP